MAKNKKDERYMRLRRFYFRYGKLVRFLYDGGSRNCAQVRLGDQHRERIGRKERHSQYLTSQGTHTDPNNGPRQCAVNSRADCVGDEYLNF